MAATLPMPPQRGTAGVAGLPVRGRSLALEAA